MSASFKPLTVEEFLAWKRASRNTTNLTARSRSDTVLPTVVFEVTSPPGMPADKRVKAVEYAAVPSVQVYVILEATVPEASIRRRASG